MRSTGRRARAARGEAQTGAQGSVASERATAEAIGHPDLARLVSRIAARSPIRAWSLIVTVYGDAVAPRGGELWLGSLTEILAPLGTDRGAVRTAVSRLANEGWLTRHRGGRHSFYRLSDSGAEAFAGATRRIYSEPFVNWSGRWRIAVLAEGETRGDRRDELRARGYGQLAQGVMIAPQSALTDIQDTGHMPGTLWFEANAVAADAPRIAERAWQLGPVAERYRRFLELFGPLETRLPAAPPLSPAEAFLLRLLLVHEFRRIVLRDPLLPQAVLPADWPGREARRLTGDIYRRVVVRSERWLDGIGRTSTGPLPPPDQHFMARFGSLAGAFALDREAAGGRPEDVLNRDVLRPED